MLAALLEFVRDLAVLAAAAGVAWWCWDQYRTSTERGDQAARLSLTAERQSVELKQWAEKLDARTEAISSHLAQLGQIAQLVQSAQVAHSAQAALLAQSRAAARQEDLERSAAAARDDEARMAARVRVHRLLQATTDPFLTFVEIERALAAPGRLSGALAAEDRDAAEDGRPDAGDWFSDWFSGDRLRRVLIDLVSDGVVAQLDRDRYFIASDYEAGDENSGGDDGDGSDAA